MKRKTFWLGTASVKDGIRIFTRKPCHWSEIIKCWNDGFGYILCRDEMKVFLRGTGIKAPRYHSKQLIPFHIVPAKGK